MSGQCLKAQSKWEEGHFWGKDKDHSFGFVLRLCQWDSHTEMSGTQSIKAFFFFNVSNLYFALKKKGYKSEYTIKSKPSYLRPLFSVPEETVMNGSL